MLGNREQPCAETRSPRGIVSINGIRKSRKGFLGEIANGLDADPPFAPFSKLGSQHGAKGFPELKPRCLIAIAKSAHKGCSQGVHHGTSFLGQVSLLFSSVRADSCGTGRNTELLRHTPLQATFRGEPVRVRFFAN